MTSTDFFKNEIKKRLTNDFEKRLLEAALFNLENVENKLRFNNFSYSLRELSRHILERLAPDNEVHECKWFTVSDPEKPKMITRNQRIKYAIQGGLSDGYVKENLKIDTDTTGKKVIKSITYLSKYTHINPETFDIEDKKISELSEKIMDAVLLLFITIEESRESLTEKLEDNVNKEVLSNLFYETINQIDCLATHYQIENYTINRIKLLRIGSLNIYFQALGCVDIKLQYGSDGDQRRDDGIIMKESFPFTGEFYGKIQEKMSSFVLETETFEVDTDDHWGDSDEILEKDIEEEMRKSK